MFIPLLLRSRNLQRSRFRDDHLKFALPIRSLQELFHGLALSSGHDDFTGYMKM